MATKHKLIRRCHLQANSSLRLTFCASSSLKSNGTSVSIGEDPFSTVISEWFSLLLDHQRNKPINQMMQVTQRYKAIGDLAPNLLSWQNFSFCLCCSAFPEPFGQTPDWPCKPCRTDGQGLDLWFAQILSYWSDTIYTDRTQWCLQVIAKSWCR